MGKKRVGQYLKKKRIEHGMTLNHVCLVSDISYSTLANWESDSVNEIKIDSLDKLLKVYKIEPGEFLLQTKCEVDIDKIVMGI